MRTSDDMDIRNRVKVKTLSGGERRDSCYFHGVVFRKNVARRKMPTNLKHPRVLLLSCPLEYDREDMRLTSLESLWAAEEEYIRIQVSKIIALQPNIVIVEKTVSGLDILVLCCSINR